MESLLIEQPENASLVEISRWSQWASATKPGLISGGTRHGRAAGNRWTQRMSPQAIEIFARVAARMGQPDRAIAALEKILSTPGNGALATGMGLTPALLPARSNVRFSAR